MPPYIRHNIGPWRQIVGSLFDDQWRRYFLLECGHAVEDRSQGYIPKNKACSLCSNNRLNQSKLQRCVGDVEGALLEGKRLKAVLHFRDKGEEPPSALLRPCCRVALFESLEDAPLKGSLDGL